MTRISALATIFLVLGTTAWASTSGPCAEDSSQVCLKSGHACFEPYTAIKKKGTLSFQFKTCDDGTLVYAKGKNKDILYIYLENGVVTVHFDVGGGATELSSGAGLNDDAWHSVVLEKLEDGNIELNVDGQIKTAALRATGSGSTSFEVEGNTCFGGVDIGEEIKAPLDGCFKLITFRYLVENPVGNAVSVSGNVPQCEYQCGGETMTPTTTAPMVTTASPTSAKKEEEKTTAPVSTTSSTDCANSDDEDCASGSGTEEPTSSGKVTIITHKPTTPTPEEATPTPEEATPTPKETEAPTTRNPTPTPTEPCDDEDCRTSSGDDSTTMSPTTMSPATTSPPPTTMSPTTEDSDSSGTDEPCDDEDDCGDMGSGTTSAPPTTPMSTSTRAPTTSPTTQDQIKDSTTTKAPPQNPATTSTSTTSKFPAQYVAEFSPGSSIQYNPTNPISTDNLNLQFNFQTKQTEAPLIYLDSGNQNGVLVHITGGKVALSIYDGAGAKRRRRSLSDTKVISEQINDGNSHDVGAQISGQSIQTKVDDVERTSEVNVNVPPTVDNVQIGAAPNQQGFEGTMGDVTVGDVNVLEMADKADMNDPQYVMTGNVQVSQSTGTTTKTTKSPIVTEAEDTEGPNLGEKTGLSGGALAGAVIGAVLGVLLVTALLVFLIIHYQKRDEGSYTLDEETPVKNGSPNNAKTAEGEGKEWYM